MAEETHDTAASVARPGITVAATMDPETTMEDLAEALRAVAAGLGFRQETIQEYLGEEN